VLDVLDVHTYYGDSHVLQGVTLRAERGRVTAVLGRNGAGKTTLCRSLTGLTPARSGHILFNGVDTARLAPHRIHEAGIGLVPQGRRIFTSLTVAENLAIAARRGRSGGAWSVDRVCALFPRLAERVHHSGGDLSGGEQQMLAIARALMANPRLLLLDEPSMGLAPVLVEQIFQTIDDINRQGTTILLVEQNASMALSIAHRAYVLETGLVALAGPAGELAENPDVRRAYLGE
jgi:branched-chain amino acid transport system ATP-binding protein